MTLFDTTWKNIKTSFRHFFEGRSPEEIASMQARAAEREQQPPPTGDEVVDFLGSLFSFNLEKKYNVNPNLPPAPPDAAKDVMAPIAIVSVFLLIALLFRR